MGNLYSQYDKAMLYVYTYPLNSIIMFDILSVFFTFLDNYDRVVYRLGNYSKNPIQILNW